MARAAEEVGFDSLWLGDHHLYRDQDRTERGPWEVWTQLAALAAITSRVSLGPLVAATAFHPPATLARMAASIDEISGGRFVLGLGAGWNEVEFRAFGFPFDQRVTRFEEAFEIIRRLLGGETLTFEGRFNRIEDAVLLPPPARPVPLMVGSIGERMLAITLPHVHWWNTWHSWYGNTPDGFVSMNAQIDEACRRAGRDPSAVKRSACVLVAWPDKSGERKHDALPVRPDDLPAHLRALHDAGADEAILVLDPINETTIRAAGEQLERLRARD